MDWSPIIVSCVSGLTGILGILIGSRLKSKATRELAALRSDDEARKIYYYELSKRVDTDTQRIDALEQRLAEKIDENIRLQRELIEATREKVALQDRVSELETQVAELKTTLAKFSCSKTACSRRLRLGDTKDSEELQ